VKKARLLTASLIVAAAAGFSSAALAETCLPVSGAVNTVNTSLLTQEGTIDLVVSNADGNVVMNETGALNGVITGAGAFGQTILSHTAKFTRGGFVTIGDEAFITGVRAVDDQNIPCSFFVTETITNMASGSGFFSSITRAHIVAEGFVSFCVQENANQFALSGQLCRGGR